MDEWKSVLIVSDTLKWSGFGGGGGRLKTAVVTVFFQIIFLWRGFSQCDAGN